MAVKLSKALQAEIFAQMEASFPNEGGGFLLGKVLGKDSHVEVVIGVANVFESEEQYHRYAMTPQNWAKMEDEADERGLALMGYYHSHPNHPAIPSIFDRDHALPNFVYIITSVMAGKAAEQRVWLLQEDRTQFNEVELIVT